MYHEFDVLTLTYPKAWCSIFSSRALSQVALRMHFPLCREIQSPPQPLDYSVFNRVSRRYAALKSGVPRQELRIPITKSRRGIYIWTFSENLLVLLSSHNPRPVLTLIYLDARTEPRRIITGELALSSTGRNVNELKVYHLALILLSISLLTTPPMARYVATYLLLNEPLLGWRTMYYRRHIRRRIEYS